MMAVQPEPEPTPLLLRRAHRNGNGVRWFALTDTVTLFAMVLPGPCVVWRVGASGNTVVIRIAKAEARRLLSRYVQKKRGAR